MAAGLALLWIIVAILFLLLFTSGRNKTPSHSSTDHQQVIRRQAKRQTRQSSSSFEYDKENLHQGYFTPDNPEKYRGDVECIIFRSNWEKRAFHYCDHSPKVIAWASEETIVPYYMKGRRKRYNYYPDLMIYFDTKETVMIEIKPKAEQQNPSMQNKCKWAAAWRYCKDRGWRFSIWTEDTIEKLWRQGDYE